MGSSPEGRIVLPDDLRKAEEDDDSVSRPIKQRDPNAYVPVDEYPAEAEHSDPEILSEKLSEEAARAVDNTEGMSPNQINGINEEGLSDEDREILAQEESFRQGVINQHRWAGGKIEGGEEPQTPSHGSRETEAVSVATLPGRERERMQPTLGRVGAAERGKGKNKLKHNMPPGIDRFQAVG